MTNLKVLVVFAIYCVKSKDVREGGVQVIKQKHSNMAFVKDGFVYHQNSRKANSKIRYLACSEYKKLMCHARATIPVGATIDHLVVRSGHNHPPVSLAVERNSFCKQLKLSIQFAPKQRLKDIYKLVQSLHPQASKICTYESMLSSMRRWRNAANINRNVS